MVFSLSVAVIERNLSTASLKVGLPFAPSIYLLYSKTMHPVATGRNSSYFHIVVFDTVSPSLRLCPDLILWTCINVYLTQLRLSLNMSLISSFSFNVKTTHLKFYSLNFCPALPALCSVTVSCCRVSIIQLFTQLMHILPFGFSENPFPFHMSESVTELLPCSLNSCRHYWIASSICIQHVI